MNDKVRKNTGSDSSNRTGSNGQKEEDKNAQNVRDLMDTLPVELENEDVYRAIKSRPPFGIRKHSSQDRKLSK